MLKDDSQAQVCQSVDMEPGWHRLVITGLRGMDLNNIGKHMP